MLLDRTLRQRYKIIRQIGSGAFGDNYLAIDLDFPHQRQCVVKHLSPKNSHPLAVAIAKRLFKDEAKSLSSLGEHDQIPRLYSYFDENEQFYLVQEFIAGNDLTSELQPGKRWNEAQTVKLLQELLQILSAVHQENKIHRDIKPANIMRRDQPSASGKANRDGKLVLIDFGAVKEILTVDRQGKTDLTVGIGTGSYMAPEQAMGKPGKYSDIYAVGMLGIQALTGLASRDLPQDSDRLKQILAESQIKISPQLKSILSKMISFQPQNRLADADSALQALKTIHKFNLSQKLWLTLFGAIALSFGLIYFLPPSAERQFSDNQPFNYDRLETYLQNKQWQEADRETNRILLEITKKDSALDTAEGVANFPCESLRQMNQLWTENSQGRFGFSPQKQVYVKTGNTIGDYTESTYQAFGDRVGWRTFGYWSLYGDLKFTDIAPVGRLPSPGKVAPNKKSLRWQEREMLLARVDQCGL